MRICVLDLGSHTFHLLSAEVRDGTVKPLADAKIAVRIGERAFGEGWIPKAAFDRGLDAVKELLGSVGGRQPIAVATGVFREARNAPAFLAEVRRRHRLDVRLISGIEEAQLTFRAVCAEVAEPDATTAVFDLGGGSLECILGRDRGVEIAESVPLGALRLTMQVPRDRLAPEIDRLVTLHAGTVLDAIRARDPEHVVFTSGTARTLLRVARALGRSEPVLGCLSRATLEYLAAKLPLLSFSETAATGVPSSRCDTIAAGAVVLASIARRFDVPFLRVTNGALREGLALHTCAQLQQPARAGNAG